MGLVINIRSRRVQAAKVCGGIMRRLREQCIIGGSLPVECYK